MAIELSTVEEFALIRLNRPQALNALSFKLVGDLSRALDEVAASDMRGLLVTGTGDKAFCAGADIGELAGRTLSQTKRGAELGQAVMAKITRLPMPSVAIVNGYAFGGGLELALACTFRLVTANAKMGLPEIKLGLIPGYGGTQRLPRLVGPGRALELILSARNVKAEEAERIGLVNRVVPLAELVNEAVKLAQAILKNGPLAVEAALECVVRGMQLPLDQGLRFESGRFGILASSEDMHEGLQAFLDKRPANFKRK
jgi:enoyl-CoA hydratase